MRYLSLPLLIPALFSIAHAQGMMQGVGTPGTGALPNMTVCSTNGSANYCAIEFVAVGSHVLSTISLELGSITGSLGPNDLEVDVYSDNGAQSPSTSLGSGYTSTTVTQSGLWYTWSGYTGATKSGMMYWLVLKNKNAAPITNYATLKVWYPQNVAPMPLITGSRTQLLQGITATYNGSSWSDTGDIGIFKIYYSDSGKYQGYPLITYSVDYANTVYSGAAVGSLFTSPSVAMSVSCITMQSATSVGTPTGNLQLQIYAGSSGTLSLLGTTDPVPSFANTGYPVTACFESPVIVPANTTIRVVMSEISSNDSSASAYRTYYMTYDGTTGGPGLTPFGGTLQETYCASSGGCTTASHWTQFDNQFVPFELFLTPGSEFVRPQSGAVN
jgi:hypothetical protein